jgi:hypothetical protein
MAVVRSWRRRRSWWPCPAIRWISRLSSTLAVCFYACRGWRRWRGWWPCPVWSGDWPFTLYILHSISWVTSTLAVLFLWLSWLVAAVRLVGGGVPSGPSTWLFTLFIHLFLLPACSISFVAKCMEMGTKWVSDNAIRAKDDLIDSYLCHRVLTFPIP